MNIKMRELTFHSLTCKIQRYCSSTAVRLRILLAEMIEFASRLQSGTNFVVISIK